MNKKEIYNNIREALALGLVDEARQLKAMYKEYNDFEDGEYALEDEPVVDEFDPEDELEFEDDIPLDDDLVGHDADISDLFESSKKKKPIKEDEKNEDEDVIEFEDDKDDDEDVIEREAKEHGLEVPTTDKASKEMIKTLIDDVSDDIHAINKLIRKNGKDKILRSLLPIVDELDEACKKLYAKYSR